VLAALCLLTATIAPATATHAPDHRFIVIGYVKDGSGRALANVPVVVTRLKTGLAHRERTDTDGLYMIVVHLHDEDEGERLAISGNGVNGEVIARFDVQNKRIERGTRIDIRGGSLWEDRRAFAETLRAYLSR
jgi:hypothetical protein